MDHHVLTIRALERPNRLHQGATLAAAVTAALRIYMAREETDWTVVTMMAAARQRPNESLAVTALKSLLRLVAPPSLAAPLLLRRKFHSSRSLHHRARSIFALVSHIWQQGRNARSSPRERHARGNSRKQGYPRPEGVR